MNKGVGKIEMNDLFRIADLNSDGLVDENEWTVF
jgi:hypothetical protein